MSCASFSVIGQNVLVQSTSELSGRCTEVAGGISPWIQRKGLAQFSPIGVSGMLVGVLMLKL